MRIRIRGSLLLVAALVTTIFVVPAMPASAAVPVTQYTPVDITDMNGPNLILSQPDGGVVLGCSGGAVGTKRVSAAGVVTQDIANASPWPSTCGRNAAVGADGTLFTAASGPTGWPMIQAIKNGTVLWTQNFSCMVSVRGMVVGTNGNVYVLVTGIQSPCGGQSTVLGYTPAGSGGTPSAVMNASVASNVVEGGIAAYDDGLVIRTDTGLQYVTYGGSVGTASTITGLLSNVSQLHHDVTLDGRMPVVVRASNTNVQLCGNDQYAVGGIHAFDASGQQWVYNSLPACSHVFTTRPTPSGGAIINYDAPQGGIPGNPRNQFLLAVDATGQFLWQQPLALGAGMVDQGLTFTVDLNGNVAVQRVFKYILQENGSTYYFPALRFVLLSGFSGGVVASTEISGPHDTSSGTGYRMHSGGGYEASTGRNTWYAPAVECSAWSCNSSTAKLYAVTVPGLQMDYPRGAILGVTLQPERLSVWLGDSFASGEGNGSYATGTDVPANQTGFNQCHRSAYAYPQLLTADSSTRLAQGGFFACSGATTANIVDTYQYNQQPPQTLLLSSSIDVVGLNIGGNDIGFGGFVRECVLSDCSGGAYDDVLDRLANDLPGRLGAAYDAVANGVGAQTRILVVNYPMMLQATANCAIFNQDETDAGRDIITKLNAEIADQVAAANVRHGTSGPTFELVDLNAIGSPFQGHELCTSNSYFYEVQVDGPLNQLFVESYHPTVTGQAAIAFIVRQRLLAQ